MIVVTTPTGNIGSKVVAALVAANAPVRVIARHPDRLAPEIAATVEVIEGAHDDDSTLDRAFAGADTVFWLVPPDIFATDTHAYYQRFAHAAVRAATAAGIKRIVAVSALGRGNPLPAGPVSAALHADETIGNSGIAYRALWCPSFMENMLRQRVPLRVQGAIYLPLPSDVKVPWTATRDIAATAVRLLLDTTWTGNGGVAVLGPETLSGDDIVAILSDVLGRPIQFKEVPYPAFKTQMMQNGANESVAQGLVDMYIAKANGLDADEVRTDENTTPTTFRAWCEAVLKPALRG